MKAAGILALLAAFNAAAATAQPAQNFLVINNTDLKVTCSTRAPNGTWDNWFVMLPGANWTVASTSPIIEFQCQPPVAQFSFTLRPGARYSSLKSGAEFTVVEITNR